MGKEIILALAPMDGVTDYPFRQVVKKYGQPDLLFTEFVSVEGLCRGAAGSLMPHLDYSPEQQPIIAQIFGKTPQYFYLVSLLVAELGFAGVDLNMGCPAKTVAQSGSGAALIGQPQLAREIIQAAKQAMQDWAKGKSLTDCQEVNPKLMTALAKQKTLWSLAEAPRKLLPVSVKTRIGLLGNELEEWLPHLIEAQPATISIHGRSLKQGYSGQADWAAIAQARELIKRANPQIEVFGNGDITDYEMAQERALQAAVDGVLIGRASFGQPFVFLPVKQRQALMTQNKRFEILLDHANIFADYQHLRGYTKFYNIRKHLAWYIKGMPDAAQLRASLVRTDDVQQVAALLKHWQGEHQIDNDQATI